MNLTWITITFSSERTFRTRDLITLLWTAISIVHNCNILLIIRLQYRLILRTLNKTNLSIPGSFAAEKIYILYYWFWLSIHLGTPEIFIESSQVFLNEFIVFRYCFNNGHVKSIRWIIYEYLKIIVTLSLLFRQSFSTLMMMTVNYNMVNKKQYQA